MKLDKVRRQMQRTLKVKTWHRMYRYRVMCLLDR